MSADNERAPVQSTREQSGVHPLLRVQAQAAFVRALLDEVEETAPRECDDVLEARIVEELARLGCRCIEIARDLIAVTEPPSKAVVDLPRKAVATPVPAVSREPSTKQRARCA